MRNIKKWEDWEVELLREHYPKQNGFVFLKRTLGRSERQIQAKSIRLGLKRNRFQSAVNHIKIEDVKVLVKSGKTINEIAKLFNIHPGTMKDFCLNSGYLYLDDYGEIQSKTGWRKLEKGQSGFNRLLESYKRGARDRGLIFELTVDEFRKLTKGNCFYCGDESSAIFHPSGKHSKWSEYKYSGIDRKDNNIGYTTINCVSCCRVCNRIKMDLDIIDFLNKIQIIAKRFPTNKKGEYSA